MAKNKQRNKQRQIPSAGGHIEQLELTSIAGGGTKREKDLESSLQTKQKSITQSRNPTSRHLPQENLHLYKNKVTLFITAKGCKQPECLSRDDWATGWTVCPDDGIPLSIGKERTADRNDRVTTTVRSGRSQGQRLRILRFRHTLLRKRQTYRSAVAGDLGEGKRLATKWQGNFGVMEVLYAG